MFGDLPHSTPDLDLCVTHDRWVSFVPETCGTVRGRTSPHYVPTPATCERTSDSTLSHGRPRVRDGIGTSYVVSYLVVGVEYNEYKNNPSDCYSSRV